jgi:predicted GIY-YIG superfamily endonuclease
MTQGIYAIRNIRNSKLYVGSSAKIEHRFSVHVQRLRTGKHENS